MRWRGRAATLVVLLGTALGFIIAAPHFRFTTKITDFLPDDNANRGAQLAALLAESELSRVMIIDLTLGEPADSSKIVGSDVPGAGRERTNFKLLNLGIPNSVEPPGCRRI